MFGPQIGGTSIGTLTLSGSGSTQQFTGSDKIQIIPYSLASGLAGNALSGFKSLFPIFLPLIQLMWRSKILLFKAFHLLGLRKFLGNLLRRLKVSRQMPILILRSRGSAAVNFDDLDTGIFTDLSNLGLVQSANYEISYTNGASLSADFAEAWTTTNVMFSSVSATFTIGVKATFDGNVSLIFGQGESVPATTAPSPEVAGATLSATAAVGTTTMPTAATNLVVICF